MSKEEFTATHKLIARSAKFYLEQEVRKDYLIITTNYDCLMGYALNAYSVPYVVLALNRNDGKIFIRLSNDDKKLAVSKTRELQRDFIEPPYLQIVCQRLWNEQANAKPPEAKTAFHFLENYQTGRAKKILEDFCREKIDKLSAREKDVIAAAFDFLVAAHGSKMAYDLDSRALFEEGQNPLIAHLRETGR